MVSLLGLGIAFLRSLFHLLLVSAGSLLAIVGTCVLIEIYQANKAYEEFKRKSNGLVMEDGRSIVCNHTLNGLRRNPMQWLMGYFAKHGGKTHGWLLHNQFAATTIDPELMKRIVLDQPNRNINRCKVDAPTTEFMEDGLMLAEDEQWRRLRRAVAPALKSSKFKAPNVVREIESSINKLLEAIEHKLETSCSEQRQQQSAIVNADDFLHRFTLDVVFRCFYKQCDLIDFKAASCRWTELVDEGLESGIHNPIFKAGLMIHCLRKPIDWLLMNFHRQGEWRRELLHFIQRQTQLSLRARKELEELRAAGRQVDEDDFELSDGSRFQRNMADHMTDHLLDGKISRREYFNTASFLITAGDKTVVDSIVYTIYRLAIDPDGVQEKLRDSVRKDGADSVYLDWVVSESLRLMPPAPVACSRTVVDELEIEDGKRLPPGTFVAYPNYIIHRLKAYWGEDADEFKPERWRDTSHHHPLQYVPFGAGVRKCPGREFALFEMKELIAKLLVRYKFHSDPRADADNFYAPFMIFLLHESPTIIKISRV